MCHRTKKKAAAPLYEEVLFDLDGTLTDSEPGILGSLHYMLEKMNLPDMADETLRTFIGPSLLESMQKALGLSEADAARAMAFYRERFAEKGWLENSLYPGADDLLRALFEKGVRIGLVTMKPEPFAHKILAHFGIDGYFACVCAPGMDETHFGKQKLIEAARTREKCVMVGDRYQDMQGAKDAGVDAIGVLYGYGAREELEKYPHVYLPETVAALGAYLLKGEKA